MSTHNSIAPNEEHDSQAAFIVAVLPQDTTETYIGAPGVVAVLPESSKDYMTQTSQEVDALMRKACHGRTGLHWRTDDRSFTRSYAVSGALQILVEWCFLAKEGEAALSYKAMREKLPRNEIAKSLARWKVVLHPGPAIREEVQSFTNALLTYKPRLESHPSRRSMVGKLPYYLRNRDHGLDHKASASAKITLLRELVEAAHDGASRCERENRSKQMHRKETATMQQVSAWADVGTLSGSGERRNLRLDEGTGHTLRRNASPASLLAHLRSVTAITAEATRLIEGEPVKAIEEQTKWVRGGTMNAYCKRSPRKYSGRGNFRQVLLY